MVEDAGAGVACPAEDAAALAAAVRRLRSLPAEEQQRMARQGRAYYERHFDPAVLAARLRQLLEDVVNRGDDD